MFVRKCYRGPDGHSLDLFYIYNYFFKKVLGVVAGNPRGYRSLTEQNGGRDAGWGT
jgi:hypothetical protein